MRQALFVLGSGRSGTTLVQRLLNSYPTTMIWGEHGGFLSNFARAYFFLKESPSMEEFSYSLAPSIPSADRPKYYKDPKLWQAWSNSFSKDELPEMFRVQLATFFQSAEMKAIEVWGFKEIRYGANDRVVEFLLELYPDCKILIVTRNGLNTLESQLTTFHRGNSKYRLAKRILQLPLIVRICRDWSRQNRYFSELLKSGDGRFVRVRYESAVEDPDYFPELFESLGMDFGEPQREIMSMIEGRGSAMRDNNNEFERWRRLGPLPLFVARRLLGRTNRLLGY